jgi:hypothetical protein
MAGFSAYLDNKLIDHTFGSATYSKPTLYLALTVSGTEVSTGGGSNYVRKACTFSIAANVATLSANVDFDAAGTNWGTIDGAAIYDAVSGGNKLADGTLTVSKTIQTGDIFRAPASGITITLT